MNDQPLAQFGALAKVGDAVAVASVLGSLTEYLPPIAALLTIIWTVLRIYESRTVQHLLEKWGRNRGKLDIS